MSGPQVEFHDGGDPVDSAARLIVAALDPLQPALILAADAAQAQALDARLWDVGDAVFLPHALADDTHPAAAHVLIVAPGQSAPDRPLVLNLRDEAVELSCQRIIEMIPPDEAGKTLARQRWRQYQSRGLKPVKH